MNTSSMIEAQATAIGMLSVYNELFAVSILEPEHFVGPYQNIFKAMLDYYKKNGFITIEALLEDLISTFMQGAQTSLIQEI